MTHGIERRVTALLTQANAEGGFPMSLVCTEQGLLVASAGDTAPAEVLAALASLFDDVVGRARRDLEMADVDELTLKDAHRGRFVLRPLAPSVDTRLFLVLQVPPALPWRRVSNRLCPRLDAELSALGADPGGDRGD